MLKPIITLKFSYLRNGLGLSSHHGNEKRKIKYSAGNNWLEVGNYAGDWIGNSVQYCRCMISFYSVYQILQGTVNNLTEPNDNGGVRLHGGHLV